MPVLFFIPSRPDGAESILRREERALPVGLIAGTLSRAGLPHGFGLRTRTADTSAAVRDFLPPIQTIMFSVQQKRDIAEKVQVILRETGHPELPEDEIQFKLHIYGAVEWSWADIQNNGAVETPHVNRHNEAAAVEMAG